MDVYSLFKLVHVTAAIAWVGGGLALIAQATFAIRSEGRHEVLRMTRGMGTMAMRWFLPSSALTFITGLILAYLGNMWSQAWIILGLAGFAATFLTGHFILRVKGEKVGELVADGCQEEAVSEALTLIQVSKFDYTVVMMVVVLMVLKPQWGEDMVLGTIAAVIALAGAVFLLPPLWRRARI